MTSFEVHGPFPVPFEKRKGGRTLVFKGFWGEGSDAAYLASERGCYVFGVRTRGLKPLYVGKATKTFKQETFNPSNRAKYHNGFSDDAKGTPVMYFVVHPKKRGPTNARQIAEIERYLIQAGEAKNPRIQNVVGTQKPSWSIKGVIRSSPGKRSSAATGLRTMFSLQK